MTINATIPRHVAIIMDGNGRWAQQRNKPRVFGHKNGVESVRSAVRACAQAGVEVLTLFAFSSENWRRPEDEVSYLMELFLIALDQEIKKLHKNNIRLRVVGDTSQFSSKLQQRIDKSQQKTQNNSGLLLNVAVNYGGRWDITQAAQKLCRQVQREHLNIEDIDEAQLQQHLCLADGPDVDLMIRTGGEQRISNFLIWQTAYSELYFTDILWPEFREIDLEKALVWFQQRERRFGRTSHQIQQAAD